MEPFLKADINVISSGRNVIYLNYTLQKKKKKKKKNAKFLFLYHPAGPGTTDLVFL
jgi:hypothetical protein